MHLGPREIDKLMLHQACFLAQKRYARGLKLNYAESVALISGQLLEYIRDGRKVSDLMDIGKNFLGLQDVLPGVADMVHEVQVEGTFPDGSKLVTVHHPICLEYGQEDLALYSSGLKRTQKPSVEKQDAIVPGETFIQDGDIELNQGRKKIELQILNTGDRPVQVGSHYPFIETNKALEFDRKSSYGFRLNIPAGTAIRFEPGESKKVELVKFGGNQVYKGGSAQIQGRVSEDQLDALMKKMKDNGFKGCEVKA